MALIITIIILILLAAISINAVFKAGIIDTATDAAIKYEKEQYREKEILDDLDNTIKDALNAVRGNRAPVFIEEAHAIDVTRTSMNITATAVDEDKDADGNPEQLTYVFYFGTSEADLIEEGRSTDTPAIFPKTGLIDGATYYFRIDVTDGKVITTGVVGNTGTTVNNKPVFANAPVGTAVANTNDQMIIEAMATDADENDILTYTLWFGTSETNLEKTNLTTEAKQGNTISFTQTGLDNDTRYYFKVAVSDGVCEDVISDGNNERTWCKGEYCSGGGTNRIYCNGCSGTGKISCSTCSGQGTIWNDRTCSTCEGSGEVPDTRTGTFQPTSGGVAEGSCPWCRVNRWYYNEMKCNHCYVVERSYICYNCNYKKGVQVNEGHDCKKTCSKCSGTGVVIVPIRCETCTGSGKVNHTDCSGKGYTTSSYNCFEHNLWSSHYYCTSSSNHGKNISQYH